MKNYDGIALFSGGLDSILAARLLMERITGNETGPCRELLVPANPVYRQSCGCAL